jgi:hypothetical protein
VTNGVLTWTGDVGFGSTLASTFSAQLGSTFAGGQVANTGVVSHPRMLSPVTAQAVAYLTTQPVLFLSKSATPDPVPLGEELVYSLRLAKAGQLATSLVVTDAIPAQAQFLPASAGANGQLLGGETCCDLPLLPPGEVCRLTYRVKVDGWPEIVSAHYGATSAEGASAAGAPVITAVSGGGRLYLPLIMR